MKYARRAGLVIAVLTVLTARPVTGTAKMAGMADTMPSSAVTKTTGKKTLYYRDPMNPSVTRRAR